MRVEGFMPIEQFRNIVDVNMPFDKGNMMMNGTRYIIDENYHRVTYDTDTVPYIIYQEEGFKHWITQQIVDVNKGFISVNTVQDIAEASAYQQMGLTKEASSYRDAVTARTSMISNGVYSHIKSHGQQGGNYRAYVGK